MKNRNSSAPIKTVPPEEDNPEASERTVTILKAVIQKSDDLEASEKQLARKGNEVANQRQSFIKTGNFEDRDSVRNAAECQVVLDMIPHKIEQIRNHRAALLPEISKAALAAQKAYRQELETLVSEVLEEIEASLAPWIDEGRLPLCADWLISKCVWAADIGDIQQMNYPYTQVTLDQARNILATHDRFRALKNRWAKRKTALSPEVQEANANRK